MQIGDLVDGRFRLIEQVGAGGMGVVFQAIDETTQAPVALKVLDSQTAEDFARARLEATSLSRCSHPAIVQYVAEGELTGGGLFLAMEWIEGTTLAARMLAEGLSLREAIVVVRRIADALATAHRAHVLHRDVKPTNVLLADNDPAAAKLIDFGVARMSDVVMSLTRTGAAIGTPGYMAPEQARGERVLTPAADVFGLGCVLYECATGQPAFSGSLAAAVLLKILFAKPPPIACPEAPRELESLIEQMLAKDLAHRLVDCEAVVAALDALPAIPDGPRRGMRGLVDAPTVRPGAAPAPEDAPIECIVGASRGHSADIFERPAAAVVAQVIAAAEAHEAVVELLATGTIAARLSGPAQPTTRRAALLALALQEILPDWSIAIASLQHDIGAAVERATRLLDKTLVASIFHRGKPGAIAVDRAAARLLESEFAFEVAANHEPWLIGRRA